MKLFFNETMQEVVAERRDDVIRVWIVTPKVFFSHVKTPQDLLFIYENVPETQAFIQRFILEAFEYFSDWIFPEDIFAKFCSWQPRTQLFLEKIANNPEWLLKQLSSAKSKSQFIELLENHSEKKSLLQAYSIILVNEFIKPEWLTVWPAVINLFAKETWLPFFKKQKSIVPIHISQIFNPLLQKHPDLLLPLFEHFFYQGNKDETSFFSDFFLITLMAQEKATEEQAAEFKLLYLGQSSLLQNVSASMYCHLIRLFRDDFDELTSIFFSERLFHSFKLSLEKLKKIALELPSEIRGTFLLRLLKASKEYQNPAFNLEDMVFLVQFCSEQISADDAALAFYLLEHHWIDTLKWGKLTQEEIIHCCSDYSCQVFALSQDNQGLSPLIHFLTQAQTGLATLLMNRLTKKAMQICLSMNKAEFKLFADQKTQDLNEFLKGLNDGAFISWITIKGDFNFDNSDLTERLSCIILSKYFKPSQELTDFLLQTNQEVFNYFMQSPQRKLNFLTRLDQNNELKACFKSKTQHLNLKDEIALLELKIEFTRSELSLKMLLKALLLWEKRAVVPKAKFYFWNSADPIPKFICELQLFRARWQQEHGSSLETINEDQKIVLHVLLQDWQRERNSYDKSTIQIVDSIVDLLQSTNGFATENTVSEMLADKPQSTRLERLEQISKEVSSASEEFASDTTKTINALIHIEKNHDRIMQFFKHQYKKRYQITECATQIHTDIIPEGDSKGYEQFLKSLIDTFIQAFDLAKSQNKLMEFTHQLRDGTCLDQRLDPLFEWAFQYAEDPYKVKLVDFIEVGYREAIAFSKVLGTPEIKRELQAEQLAQFIVEHYGVRICHENNYNIAIVDQLAIANYAKEVLHLESAPKKSLFLSYFSH